MCNLNILAHGLHYYIGMMTQLTTNQGEMTILETLVGKTAFVVKNESLIGPKGSINWKQKNLNDGRIIFIGPDTHGCVPNWIKKLTPKNHRLIRAGGTTYRWSAWISEIQ